MTKNNLTDRALIAARAESLYPTMEAQERDRLTNDILANDFPDSLWAEIERMLADDSREGRDALEDFSLTDIARRMAERWVKEPDAQDRIAAAAQLAAEESLDPEYEAD